MSFKTVLYAIFCTVMANLLVACACEENGYDDFFEDGSTFEEVIPECVRFVDEEADERGDGLSWETAFSTLEEGIASANTANLDSEEAVSCEVWVKDQTESVASNENWENGNQNIITSRTDNSGGKTYSNDGAAYHKSARVDGIEVFSGFRGHETIRRSLQRAAINNDLQSTPTNTLSNTLTDTFPEFDDDFVVTPYSSTGWTYLAPSLTTYAASVGIGTASPRTQYGLHVYDTGYYPLLIQGNTHSIVNIRGTNSSEVSLNFYGTNEVFKWKIGLDNDNITGGGSPERSPQDQA